MKNKRFILFLLFSVLLAACGRQPEAAVVADEPANPSLVIVEGRVVPAQDMKLNFMAQGKVDEILVDEGDSVRQGDVLVRLADREQAEAALASAELELAQAQQAYDEFQRQADLAAANAWEAYLTAQAARGVAQSDWDKVNPNTIEDQIDTADQDVKDKAELVDDARTELDNYIDLDDNNPARTQAEDDLRVAEANYHTAVNKLEELQRSLDKPKAALDAAFAAEAEALRKYESTQGGVADPEQEALYLARLDNAKAQVAAAQNNLAHYDLLAPFDGVVTDVNVAVGQLIGSEIWAVQMADFSAWYVETSDLTELEVVKISEGQIAAISPDALDDVSLSGVVEQISLSYKTQGGDVLYTVLLKLDSIDPALRWGMTVEIAFNQ